MARNIINPQDIDALLEDLEEGLSPDLITWLRSVARRWILRDFTPLCRIIGLTPAEGTQKMFVVQFRLAEGGTAEIYAEREPWIDPEAPQRYQVFDRYGDAALDLEDDLHAALLYLKSLQPISVARLSRITLPQALEAGRALVAREAQAAIDHRTLQCFDDGYRIILLENEADLHEEGREMSHCAVSYAKALERREIDLLSLRDAGGKPHVTMELRGGKIVQIRGRGNARVAPRYRPYVQDFLTDWEIPIAQERDMLALPHRSFDPQDPAGWQSERFLKPALQQAGRTNAPVFGLAQAFEEDLMVVIDELDDATWNWVLSLFQEEDGRFSAFYRVECLEVAGQLFTQRELMVPRVLLSALNVSGLEKRWRLQRTIRAELEGALLRFLQTDSHSVLAAGNLPNNLTVDISGLRWAHLARVRRALAKARKQARRAALDQDSPKQLTEGWRANWAELADRLHRREMEFC